MFALYFEYLNSRSAIYYKPTKYLFKNIISACVHNAMHRSMELIVNDFVYSGITCGRVFNSELCTQRLIYQ